MYKIFNSTVSEEIFIIKNGTWILKNPDSTSYQKFIKDVAEQGLDIVEGPDVKSPSYAELRMAEYPSREEQFDMQFHDQVNGTTTWRDTIQAIKDKYPKTITGSTTIGPIPAWVQEAVDAYRSNS
jgi:hypothetical protein